MTMMSSKNTCRASNPRTVRVEGIVLAAGLSTRMGYCKLNAELAGSSVIQRVMDSALNSELDRVILVSGTDLRFDIVLDDAIFPKFKKIYNLNPERGMAWSIRNGLESMEPDTSGAMILLGDQPGISSENINELVEEFRWNKDKIVVPFVRGRRTTPVIFPVRLFQELCSVTGDTGGREILRRHAEDIKRVELDSCYDDTDVDTPEDLEKIRQSLEEHGRLNEN